MSYTAYDVIIVGAGIAGLSLGIDLLTFSPKLRCCILEKASYLGGRAVTWHGHVPRVGDVSWEGGAGRISFSHHHVRRLFDRYDLTLIPISPTSVWIDPQYHGIIQSSPFSFVNEMYLQPLLRLKPYQLQTHTLYELLVHIHGKKQAEQLAKTFPYSSEFYELRADHALHAFQHEMKSDKGFGVCKGGISTLIDRMVSDFLVRGGIILKQVEVCSISSSPSPQLECKDLSSTSTSTIMFQCSTCVLALPSEAVRTLKGVAHMPLLQHVRMTPLLRIYAVYPASHTRPAWFHDLPKIVTPSLIRYIIPIWPEKGIIMISYTDGRDTTYWANVLHRRGRGALIRCLQNELHRLFPDRSIPEPLLVKTHLWDNGCSYWQPGTYNIAKISQQSLHPLPQEHPSLFMCNESYAESQCWLESSLKQASRLMQHHLFLQSIHKLHL